MFPFFVLKYCERDKENNFFNISKENYIKLFNDLEKSLNNGNGNGSNSSGMSLKPEPKSKNLLSLDM